MSVEKSINVAPSTTCMRDFSGQNLRGRNFKGQDLSGADFSDADIRGAKFTNAILRGANFTGAKSGLQRRWVVGQILLIFLISALLGGLQGYFGAWIGFYFPRWWDSSYDWTSFTTDLIITISYFITIVGTVTAIATVAQSKSPEEKSSVMRKAKKMLDATIAALPSTATLVEACTKLLPTIAKLLGISL